MAEQNITTSVIMIQGDQQQTEPNWVDINYVDSTSFFSFFFFFWGGGDGGGTNKQSNLVIRRIAHAIRKPHGWITVTVLFWISILMYFENSLITIMKRSVMILRKTWWLISSIQTHPKLHISIRKSSMNRTNITGHLIMEFLCDECLILIQLIRSIELTWAFHHHW